MIDKNSKYEKMIYDNVDFETEFLKKNLAKNNKIESSTKCV